MERAYYPGTLSSATPLDSFRPAFRLPVPMMNFEIERRLPARTTTTVELLPERPGEVLFTCKNGVFIGNIKVRPAGTSAAERRQVKF